MHRRRFVALGASALAMPALSRVARAETYPSRIVRLVVPFPPGGAVDVAARIIANQLSQQWGQQMMIENKGGAGGNIAAMSVVNAEADGYTVYICSIGHAINQFMYPNMGYDPVADFAPVTLMCVYPNIMAVPLSSPDHSVQDYIARAKANPGKVTYCSSGVGTSLHLCGELFKRMAGVEITHIPYRGAAPALNDLIPGRVDAIFANFPSTLPYVQSGRLRGLAVTTAQRQPEVPDLPAIAEIVPGYDVSSWFALFVVAKTPSEIVAKLNRDAVEALNTPSVKEHYAKLGAQVVASTPAVLAAHLKSEMERWGPIIKAAGITIDKS
ncbi:MAG: tripartite tricarboxylate transporter substrate binding protein [Alphaproteobacteria bacterium]|nr:tripartite tricarboxylate transporter substrate binding protein [Alphaproteobacteria bacterium]